MRRKGASLPENVVVHLGTNGTFPLSTCKAIVKAAGPDRRVFLVNVFVPRSWEDSNNAVIRQCNEAFAADRVHVIDWNSALPRLTAAGSTPTGSTSSRQAARPSPDCSTTRSTNAVRDARSAALASASGSGTARLEG